MKNTLESIGDMRISFRNIVGIYNIAWISRDIAKGNFLRVIFIFVICGLMSLTWTIIKLPFLIISKTFSYLTHSENDYKGQSFPYSEVNKNSRQSIAYHRWLYKDFDCKCHFCKMSVMELRKIPN